MSGVTPLVVAGSTPAALAAVAGAVLVDAGAVLVDAGAVLVDAGATLVFFQTLLER